MPKYPDCDDVIQRQFVYVFEYDFPTEGRLTYEERDKNFQQFLTDFKKRNKEVIYIESYNGSPDSYPWVKAYSDGWRVVRKFVGEVRRRLRGRPGYHFEEDYSHVNT